MPVALPAEHHDPIPDLHTFVRRKKQASIVTCLNDSLPVALERDAAVLHEASCLTLGRSWLGSWKTSMMHTSASSRDEWVTPAGMS